jgi:hypothetical protein
MRIVDVREKTMRRLGREARVFPLLGLDGRPSPLLVPVTAALRDAGFEVAVRPVGYEFQKGGDRMLRVTRRGDRPGLTWASRP